MIRLARYTKPYLGKILLGVVLLFAQAYFDLALPAYLSRLVNAQVLAGGLENAISAILRDGGVMLALSLGSMVSAVAVVFISAQVAAGMARDIRGDLFAKVNGFSNAEFDRFSTASLVTRSTNDVTQVQLVTMMLIRIVFYAPIIAVGGILRLAAQNSAMWWLIAVAVMVLIGLLALVVSLSMPRFRIIQALIDRLNRIGRENLVGMMVVRAFNREPFEKARFDGTNGDLAQVTLFVNRATMLLMPVMTLVMNVLSLGIVWAGSRQVGAGAMQVGDVMASVLYASQIVMAVLILSTIVIILPRASVSGNRIAEVLETVPAVADPATPEVAVTPLRGELEFRDVSFRYLDAEKDALRGISFTARPGQTTAIIGPTGAGKSTLANLILRFYDVTGGEIRIDDVDIRRMTRHDLRAQIGYVPQKSSLFSGTVESNLRYGDGDASDADIQAAITVAQAAEFITVRPEGAALPIAQDGANVSGGQKQRLSIARALVKKAPICIFDDSFSALDLKTEAALRRALKTATGNSTTLVVAQRVSSIKDADQILVMDEGRIVGRGTHMELMMTCALYREIASSQLNGMRRGDRESGGARDQDLSGLGRRRDPVGAEGLAS
jgi:ATP-binding cassette, subfamily B, multidrug efflux pump